MFFSGWWESYVGPNRCIDTERFRVICPAHLGSPFGTTSPITKRKGGFLSFFFFSFFKDEIYGPEFPQITPTDMVRVAKLLLDNLGIGKVYATIGGSLGGNLVFAFVSSFPDFAKKGISISGAGQTCPMSVGLRFIYFFLLLLFFLLLSLF